MERIRIDRRRAGSRMRRRAAVDRQREGSAPLQYVAGGGVDDDPAVDDLLVRIDAAIDLDRSATTPSA